MRETNSASRGPGTAVTGADGPPVVEFRDVTVRLGGRTVLDGLSLAARPAETLVLLGRSGAGKSTTLRLVNRLLVPDRGEVRVLGRSTPQWDPILLRRRIGYVIQEVGLFPHFSVARNVGLVPRLCGWAEERTRARVEELLRQLGLPPDEFAERRPGELSGGEQQRVGVARALAADPDLLLCDEPFAALDPLIRHELRREFRSLGRRLGKCLLFVTHDVREALYLGDRIAFLDEGSLRFVGTREQFRETSDSRIRAFLTAAGL
ncbi:MAG: ATP-binding cassette domain-containing protein [Gemmatimonadota bacterium]